MSVDVWVGVSTPDDPQIIIIHPDHSSPLPRRPALAPRRPRRPRRPPPPPPPPPPGGPSVLVVGIGILGRETIYPAQSIHPGGPAYADQIPKPKPARMRIPTHLINNEISIHTLAMSSASDTAPPSRLAILLRFLCSASASTPSCSAGVVWPRRVRACLKDVWGGGGGSQWINRLPETDRF